MSSDAEREAVKMYPHSLIATVEDFREVARYNFVAGAEWVLAQLPDREAVARASTRLLAVGVVAMTSPRRSDRIISPDCRDGFKCRACDGGAWDMETDQPAACECGCHEGAN